MAVPLIVVVPVVVAALGNGNAHVAVTDTGDPPETQMPTCCSEVTRGSRHCHPAQQKSGDSNRGNDALDVDHATGAMPPMLNRALIVCALIIASACRDLPLNAPDAAPDGETSPRQIIRLDQHIVKDTVLTAENTYVISRHNQVFVESGTTLVIQRGTVIKGEEGAVLVITRGAKIIADGTPVDPIILTSAQPDGQKTPGYWGGLIVFGAAPINTNTLSNPSSAESSFDGLASAALESKFGGPNPADNSGVLRYVRIEFAGFSYSVDHELANLTMCGVGSGTTVDYVQTQAGSGNGFGFFGGTVNVKHLVGTQNAGAGIDSDNGWQGKAQFVVVQSASSDVAREGSGGLESNNNGNAAFYAAPPRTLPIIYNISLFGDHRDQTAHRYAIVLRRGAGGRYYNAIVAGFANGIEVRDLATKQQLDNSNLFFKNSIFFGNAADGNHWPPPEATDDIDEAAYFTNAAWSNRFVDPDINQARLSLTAPNFVPNPGGAATIGAATPPNDGFFDPNATFVGAFGAVDWTQGWTAYPQPAKQ